MCLLPAVFLENNLFLPILSLCFAGLLQAPWISFQKLVPKEMFIFYLFCNVFPCHSCFLPSQIHLYVMFGAFLCLLLCTLYISTATLTLPLPFLNNMFFTWHACCWGMRSLIVHLLLIITPLCSLCDFCILSFIPHFLYLSYICFIKFQRLSHLPNVGLDLVLLQTVCRSLKRWQLQYKATIPYLDIPLACFREISHSVSGRLLCRTLSTTPPVPLYCWFLLHPHPEKDSL